MTIAHGRMLPPAERAEALARKFVEASLVAPTPGNPGLVLCWPSARMNKYQSLIYRQALAHGFAVERISALEDLETIFWPGSVIFHAHWFAQLAAGAETAEAYDVNIERGFAMIDAFVARTGAKTVWTAHNLLPHGSPFPEVDLKLRRRVIDRFDLVHVMEEHQTAVIEALVERDLPNTVVAPHPHYASTYADHVEHEEAREQLGFDPGTTVLLSFGSIQRYKKIAELVAAFRQAREFGRHDLRLMIAGYPSDREHVAEIVDLVARDPAIRFMPSKVPDEQVQHYFRAADAAILPYGGEQLNSGAAILALTFDCPVIVPDEPAFAPLRKFGIEPFANGESGSLARALAAAGSGQSQIDFAAFRAAHDPTTVSNRLFGAFSELCG